MKEMYKMFMLLDISTLCHFYNIVKFYKGKGG